MRYKKLTVDNWLEVDPDGSSFFSINHEEGTISRTSGEHWLAEFLRPQLSESVPDEIRDLFEIARCSMPYGHFFYPLFTLAGEQLYRVGELAIRMKYIQLGGPELTTKNRKVTLLGRLKWLRTNGHISTWDWEDWDFVRKGRNHFSHPESATKVPPASVAGLVDSMARKINKLFVLPNEKITKW